MYIDKIIKKEINILLKAVKSISEKNFTYKLPEIKESKNEIHLIGRYVKCYFRK